MRIALVVLLAACGSKEPAPFRISTVCNELSIAAMGWRSSIQGMVDTPVTCTDEQGSGCRHMEATSECFQFARAAARAQGELNAYERARMGEIPRPLFEKVDTIYNKLAGALDEVASGADLCQENFRRRDFPIHENDKFEPQRWIDAGAKQALAALAKVDAAIAECNTIK